MKLATPQGPLAYFINDIGQDDFIKSFRALVKFMTSWPVGKPYIIARAAVEYKQRQGS